MAELKPCPFCGDSVTLDRAPDAYDVATGYFTKRWAVRCEGRLLSANEAHYALCGIQQTSSPSPEIAIERWNTRVAPNPYAYDRALNESKTVTLFRCVTCGNSDRLMASSVKGFCQPCANRASLGLKPRNET
jgi:hypothetical protein